MHVHRLAANATLVILTLFTLVLAPTFAAPARALDPEVPLAELAVTRWDREAGLPTNAVRALARNARGLWYLGTDIGLVAFDGLTFTRRTTETDPGLPSDAIEVLAIDDSDDAGALWIGTPRGLARLEEGVVSGFGPAEGLPVARVFALLVDRRGWLWIGSAAGVFLRRDGHIAPLSAAHDAPVDDACQSFAALLDGGVALACSGVLRVWRDGTLGDPIAGLGADDVSNLAAAADGGLWVGGPSGRVQHVRFSAGRAVVELTASRPDGISALHVDPSGALWITGNGPGVTRRTPAGKSEELVLPDGGQPSGVLGVADGPEGEVLLATLNLGLVRARAAPFRLIDRRSGAPINVLSVFPDRHGALWLASVDEPTLFALAPGAAEPRRFALELPVLTHLEDPDGTHWLGTAGGLLRQRDAALEPVPLGADDSGAPVTALVRSPDGALWLGRVNGGLQRRAVDGTVTNVARADGEALQVSALALAHDGATLWIGSAAGVCRLPLRGPADAKVECLDEARGGPRGLVVALYADAAGSVWVGLFERGLVRLRDERAVVFGQAQGLRQSTHYAVLEDAAGRLWLPGPTGITRVERAALDAIAEGRAMTAPVRFFDRADGLPVDETNGGGQCAAVGPDGRLWFATPRGTVVIDPSRPDPAPRSPPASIDALESGGRALPLAGLSLSGDEHDLLVRYSAPTFERAAEVRFRYRLEGVDADWVDAGTRRLAMYTDLPPGRRRFEVQARAAGATDFGATASFSVARAPSFSETAGFKLLVASAAAVLIYVAYRWRVAHLVARQRELGQLVAARTSELAAAKVALEDVNAGLERRVDEAVTALRGAERMAAYGHTVAGVAHEVRQPLFALSTASFVLGNKLLDRPELQGDLATLTRETRRMNRVMEDLLEFAKPRGLLLGEASLEALLREAIDGFRAAHDPDAALPIELACDPALPKLRVDSVRLQQVLINLMHNAQKHATGMRLLRLAAHGDGPGHVAIEVIDDGQGIQAADLPRIFEPFFTTGGTGLGLAIARRIAEDHGGSLAVASSPRGTVFRLVLPVQGPDRAG